MCAYVGMYIPRITDPPSRRGLDHCTVALRDVVSAISTFTGADGVAEIIKKIMNLTINTKYIKKIHT